MRRIAIVSALALAVVTATIAVDAPFAAASDADAQPVTPAACAADLNCSLDDINTMSMAQRLQFVRDLEAEPVAKLLPGTDSWRWRNIEGIVAMFENQNLGAPGSWISYTDAGILEGVERGIAIASGTSAQTGGNPGAQLWANYLRELAAGQLTDRSVHDKTWSLAEQAATDHGSQVAEQQHGKYPTATENRFMDFTQLYRFMLRNRPQAMDVVAEIWPLASPGQREDFYDWATDVTNWDAGRTGAELLWQSAALNAPGTTLDTVVVLQAYFTSMLSTYLATR